MDIFADWLSAREPYFAALVLGEFPNIVCLSKTNISPHHVKRCHLQKSGTTDLLFYSMKNAGIGVFAPGYGTGPELHSVYGEGFLHFFQIWANAKQLKP